MRWKKNIRSHAAYSAHVACADLLVNKVNCDAARRQFRSHRLNVCVCVPVYACFMFNWRMQRQATRFHQNGVIFARAIRKSWKSLRRITYRRCRMAWCGHTAKCVHVKSIRQLNCSVLSPNRSHPSALCRPIFRI